MLQLTKKKRLETNVDTKNLLILKRDERRYH
jgi:hypothetical protein